MLRANSEVSTIVDISFSTTKVCRIASTPISSGIDAATTPRKTISSSSARIGKAISSALVRSSRVWSFDLVEARRVAAHRDVEAAVADRRLRVLGGVAALVLDVGGGEVAGDEDRPAVGLDQRRGAAVLERVVDEADALDPGDRLGEPVDLLADGGIVEVERAAAGGAHHQRDPGVGVVAEPVPQGVGRDGALRGVVGEPGGLQVLLDVAGEAEAGQDHNQDRREDGLGIPPGQARDSLEHPARTLCFFTKPSQCVCAQTPECRIPRGRGLLGLIVEALAGQLGRLRLPHRRSRGRGRRGSP